MGAIFQRLQVVVVVVLLTGIGWGADDALGQEKPAPPVATASPAAAAPAPAPAYDIWTTKRLTGDWGGTRTDLENQGISFAALLGTTAQFNFRGGLNTHNACDVAGRAFYILELDFQKMKLVDGGSFFARAVSHWNPGIQGDVGSLTPPYWVIGSGRDQWIELDKYWYRQRLWDDRVEFRLGKLQNIADLFDKNAYAENYMNQFVNQALNYNAAMPYTKGIGAFGKVWPADWLYLQMAAMDPDTINTHNRHGTGGFDTAFHDDCRFRGFWEVGMLPKHLGVTLPGNYRLGCWYDPLTKRVFGNNLGALLTDRFETGDVGYYFSADQMVWKENEEAKDKQGLGVFARYGWADEELNRIEHFWSLGASYQGLVPQRNADVLAFGMAQSILSGDLREFVNARADRETVYELYYAFEVTPWCTVSPDFQVITNPGGSKDARDAIVGGVRVKLSF